jgi:hypothetical protein
MVPFFYGPRERHPGVDSVETYRSAHAVFIARKAAKGARYVVHEDAAEYVARIEANSWLVDCACGNGCLTDPEFGIACCYGCGAVLTTVTFPEPVALAQLEALLVARPLPKTRNWTAEEPVDAIVAENEAKGIIVPDLKAIEVAVLAKLKAIAIAKGRTLP